MKRLFLAILLAACLLLGGCSQLIPSEYVSVSPHSGASSVPVQKDAVNVSSYSELKQALRELIRDGVEQGIIHIRQYVGGDVEEDLDTAVYEVTRADPTGVYAVDYLTYDCSLIISYYEVDVHISYRDMATKLDEIEYVASQSEVRRIVSDAMSRYANHVTIYAGYLTQPDYEQMVRDNFEANPATLMALPTVRVTDYPDTDRERIVELIFDYPDTPTDMWEMKQAVADTLSAATVYVRYRESETEKARLLFTYLAERFRYQQGETATPIYSALCEGTADSESMAKSWQLLCDQVGIDCVTVKGMRGGEDVYWNILCPDGQYCHVDILRDLLDDAELHLRFDEDMAAEYYWDTQTYHPCPMPEPEIPAEPTEAPPEEETGEQPEEIPADEQPPDEEEIP